MPKFKISISQYLSPGYSQWVSSWACPLCPFRIHEDLALPFVQAGAIDHMMTVHRALRDHLELKLTRHEKGKVDDRS